MASNYTVEELLLNESFTKYCLDPDRQTIRKWEKLVSEKKISQHTIDEAAAILRMLSPALSKSEINEEVNKLRDHIDENEQFHPLEYPESSTKSKRKWQMAGLAAILAIVIPTVYYAMKPSIVPVPEIVAKFSTGTGEQKKVILPDGTSVTLNSNSGLTYDREFNEKTRTVHLIGDAFFRVAKNPEKPFIVVSNQFSTTALGTAFYVNSDSADSYSVRLLEGKVKISSDHESETAFLAPGEEILWQSSSHHFSKAKYDTAYLSNWASGRIIFKQTPFHEALSILKDWYGVDIIDRRSDKTDITINGTYENVLLEDILKVICFSMNCTIEYGERSIIIR